MKMTTFFAVALAALALIPTGTALAADEETSLIGEPIDINCYLGGGKSGEGHAACARSCAERGNPIGFLVTEGDAKQVYLVLGSEGKSSKDLMVEHMGAEVEVIGKVQSKDGLKVIVVSEVVSDDDEWFLEETSGAGSVKNNEN
ncbi:MAG: hypothetical protein COA73_07125 [Candidatus Hydrogenedentota bacterium]|nr:MAG: hypothetical protein COA73_07125 [Candidatus Hydrogenedentota bacterium]